MEIKDQIKAIELVLSDPANNLTVTSRELLDTVKVSMNAMEKIKNIL